MTPIEMEPLPVRQKITIAVWAVLIAPSVLASLVLVSAGYQDSLDRKTRHADREEFMAGVRKDLLRIEAIVGDVRPRDVLAELQKFRTEALGRLDKLEKR